MSVVEDCLAHVVDRGLARSATGVTATVTRSTPGYEMLTVTGPGIDAVVKRCADADRLDAEAGALRVVRTLVPGTVPPVLDLNGGYLVLARAPRDWTTWLRPGRPGPTVDVEAARRLGWMLGRLQRRTSTDPEIRGAFADRPRRPETARRAAEHWAAVYQATEHRPELLDAVEVTVDAMKAADDCLVHGAFAPAHVLLSPPPATGITLGARRLWLIGWNAVHLGDPTTDPATLVAALLDASVRHPEDASRYEACAQHFVDALQAERADLPPLDRSQLSRRTGCLLVGATAGERAADLGCSLLLDPVPTLREAWRRLSRG